MVPSHLDASTTEGVGFLASGWIQIGLAALVLSRPTRAALAGTIVASVAFIVAWGISRTEGLPFGAHAGHPESVTFVDGSCVALEAAAIVLAGLILARRGRIGTSVSSAISGMAIAGALGAVALASAAVLSPDARDHSAGAHGDHAAAGADRADGAAAAGHDHGDGMEDGAAHDHGDAPAAGGHDHGEGMTDDAAAGGHDHGAMEADDKGFSLLSNGHQHETGVEPLTPEETAELAGQLAVTAELMQRYPTVADAEAAGYRRAGPFAPGLGAHYQSDAFVPNTDGDMDREDLLSPILVYDGVEPTSQLAGFMFMYFAAEAPEGFAGPNDHWHYHERVCLVKRPDGGLDSPFGADIVEVTQEMCDGVGGSFLEFTGYMVHVWNVPGYESPDGMFTELNRAITCEDGTYYRIEDFTTIGSRSSICLDA
jgi:hypothetical protein